MGTVMAGVDFLEGVDGQRYAIEVNAVPGWRALGPALNIDVSERILRYIQSRIEIPAIKVG
jgi:ribosomal protein S6--L-glutamate ligase